MARVHGIAILTCILGGTAAWIWLARTGDDGPPVATLPSDAPASAPGGPGAEPEAAQRDAMPVPGSAPVQPSDVTPRPTDPPPAAADLVPALVLTVTDATTAERLPAFRWRWQSGTEVRRGDGVAGVAKLELPLDRSGDLLVEAADHQSLLERGVVLSRREGAIDRLDLALQGAAIATGISLALRTADGQPVERVRVDAFRLTAPGEDHSAWQLGRPLWTRQATTQDGTCTLPDLPPGRYGIRVLAVDADTRPLPLLPYRQVFELTGSNGFRESVALDVGCVPGFTLVDGSGTALDPERQAVGLMLRPPGGPDVSRYWEVSTGTSRVQSLDHLPAAGTATPGEPLPAGNYEFEVRIGGETRVRRMVALQVGVMQPEQIVVR